MIGTRFISLCLLNFNRGAGPVLQWGYASAGIRRETETAFQLLVHIISIYIEKQSCCSICNLQKDTEYIFIYFLGPIFDNMQWWPRNIPWWWRKSQNNVYSLKVIPQVAQKTIRAVLAVPLLSSAPPTRPKSQVTRLGFTCLDTESSSRDGEIFERRKRGAALEKGSNYRDSKREHWDFQTELFLCTKNWGMQQK